MKEELFHMLDGELPDEGVAELLHRLSVDPEKRTLFLQQLRLQHALAYNGGQTPMSTVETVEMRDRIAAAIGAGGGIAPRSRFRGRVLGPLAAGLIIGSGLGFVVDRIASGDGAQPPAAEMPASPLTPRQSTPVAAIPNDTSAGTDSAAMRASAADSTAKPASGSSRSGRKAAVRTKTRKPSYGDDLTGAPEAREIAKKKRSSRSNPE